MSENLKAWLHYQKSKIELGLKSCDDVEGFDNQKLFVEDIDALFTRIARLEAALKWIAQWGDGCPANSDYDKGLKAAHDALSSKARKALETE